MPLNPDFQIRLVRKTEKNGTIAGCKGSLKCVRFFWISGQTGCRNPDLWAPLEYSGQAGSVGTPFITVSELGEPQLRQISRLLRASAYFS